MFDDEQKINAQRKLIHLLMLLINLLNDDTNI